MMRYLKSCCYVFTFRNVKETFHDIVMVNGMCKRDELICFEAVLDQFETHCFTMQQAMESPPLELFQSQYDVLMHWNDVEIAADFRTCESKRKLSKSFRTHTDIRQLCPLSAFLFKFVIDETGRRTQEVLRKPDCQIFSVYLEYAIHTISIFEEVKTQVLLDELITVFLSIVMHFERTTSKDMILGMQLLKKTPTIKRKAFEIKQRFTYLGRCIDSSCRVTHEVNPKLRRARSAFA
ncbi:hypothetical protein T265_11698 [Opisthorchis viverrini]|uniref:Uncharacterized protein n=1 Tax=Opisthorchis viverrini TaxID=6198 RepID=A0A074YXQ2_OPIVI|nr:hypothetical protein T265_11698 [Opisthorchis viverrini]KER19576.1 hypothetical protein T265_11698 [Opisthorchis viverrini]